MKHEVTKRRRLFVRRVAREVSAEILRKEDPRMLRDLEIDWSSRMTTAAGYAYLGEARIQLSLPILAHSKRHDVAQTVAHEIAHLYAAKWAEDQHHGPGWRHTMERWGYRPEIWHTLHRYPLVAYHCGMVQAVCSKHGVLFARNPLHLQAIALLTGKSPCPKCGTPLKARSGEQLLES